MRHFKLIIKKERLVYTNYWSNCRYCWVFVFNFQVVTVGVSSPEISVPASTSSETTRRYTRLTNQPTNQSPTHPINQSLLHRHYQPRQCWDTSLRSYSKLTRYQLFLCTLIIVLLLHCHWLDMFNIDPLSRTTDCFVRTLIYFLCHVYRIYVYIFPILFKYRSQLKCMWFWMADFWVLNFNVILLAFLRPHLSVSVFVFVCLSVSVSVCLSVSLWIF